MRKQQKQMLILLLVLVFLGAGFWGLRQYNQAQSEKPVEEDTITVVEFEDEEILWFTYDYQGTSYTFEKEEDVWYYADDHSLTIDQARIKTMIAKVAPLEVEQVIENVTDKTQYGLAEPSGDTTRIEYATSSESIVLEVGDYNSLMNIYYVCKPAETTVYAVKGNVVTGFGYALEDLVEAEETEEADSAESSEAAETSSGAESTETAEASDGAESTEATETSDSGESTEAAETSDSGESTEAAEASDSGESIEAAETSNTAESS